MEAAGIDASRGRSPRSWIVVRIDDAGLRALAVHPTLEAALADCSGASAVAVNLPLGHEDPEGRAGGKRSCDHAARDLLGPHAERHPFYAPPRLYDEPDLDAATAAAARDGVPAPRAADWVHRERILTAMRAAAAGAPLHEAHAEVSFHVLAASLETPGAMDRPRTTTAGFQQRLALLHRVGLRPARSFGGIGRAHPEDVLDATALAWTAGRVATGTHRVLGTPPAPLILA